MEIDCIPAGMELFPAADEEQFEFIKRVIDDCDYYLLIIGGRYGSTDPEGVSYTEKEYDYAIERNIKVVALLHESPDTISVEKSDINAELRARLAEFREKVSKGRLVKFWKSLEELPGLVAINLPKTIKAYPAVGWVRGDQLSNTEVLAQLNEIRNEKSKLENELLELKAQVEITPIPFGLAALEEEFDVSGEYHSRYNNDTRDWSYRTNWQETFGLIAPHLLTVPNDDAVKRLFAVAFLKKSGKNGSSVTLDDEIFQTIKVQLLALGFVNVHYSQTVGGGMGLFWSVTDLGRKKMLEIRSVKAT